jgi:glycosyltransferase involved in cell wall biosynthesis
MPTNPFYSIIIPTYNRASIVQNTVQQLKLQSFLNWECIVVDDGSTDNTKDIIEELSKNDNRINYIFQQNSERSIARNNGASIAKGEYFIFLDSDDEFELNHLELLYKHIIDSNCMKGMYFTNGKIKSVTSIQSITNQEIPNTLPLDYFIDNSVIPARVCLHNTIFKNHNFDPRTIIVEDTVLWTEILDNYPVKYIPIDTVIYCWHEDNSVNIKKFNAYKKRLIGLKILFYNKSVGKKINNKTKDKHLNRCYIGIAQYNAYQNNRIKSQIWILLSLMKYPRLDLKYKIGLLLNGFDLNKS